MKEGAIDLSDRSDSSSLVETCSLSRQESLNVEELHKVQLSESMRDLLNLSQEHPADFYSANSATQNIDEILNTIGRPSLKRDLEGTLLDMKSAIKDLTLVSQDLPPNTMAGINEDEALDESDVDLDNQDEDKSFEPDEKALGLLQQELNEANSLTSLEDLDLDINMDDTKNDQKEISGTNQNFSDQEYEMGMQQVKYRALQGKLASSQSKSALILQDQSAEQQAFLEDKAKMERQLSKLQGDYDKLKREHQALRKVAKLQQTTIMELLRKQLK